MSSVGWSYKVQSHEHLDAKFAKVTLHCIGYGADDVQPDGWDFVMKVPVDDLGKWPLGSFARLSVEAKR